MKIFLKSQEAEVDRVGQIGMLVSRVVIGLLWFTQLLWKMPPTFGCPANFAVTTSISARTTGLCDWIGMLTIYSTVPVQSSLVKSLVVPNISWMGWLIWLMEAFVAVSLILGVFTRLGGLMALLQGLNLYFGLSVAPGEWYWTYGMLSVLGLIFMAVPTGRFFGLDAWLRPRFKKGADKGSFLAKILLALT